MDLPINVLLCQLSSGTVRDLFIFLGFPPCIVSASQRSVMRAVTSCVRQSEQRGNQSGRVITRTELRIYQDRMKLNINFHSSVKLISLWCHASVRTKSLSTGQFTGYRNVSSLLQTVPLFSFTAGYFPGCFSNMHLRFAQESTAEKAAPKKQNPSTRAKQKESSK